MLITNSPDISQLNLQVIFDLSVAIPVVRFVNTSVGDHLNNVQYIFEVKAPSGFTIHSGVFTSPDQSGVWSTYNLTDSLYTFNGKDIEWSGNPYSVKVSVKDSVGTIYTSPVQLVTICTPAGNKSAGKTYGGGKVGVEVDCVGKNALIKDLTVYTYQGVPGSFATRFTVTQPADADGNQQAAQNFINTPQVLFPLTVAGKGFQAILSSTADYNFDIVTNTLAFKTTVRLKYLKTQNFNVNCGYTLDPILLKYHEFVQANKGCVDKDILNKSRLIQEQLFLALLIERTALSPFSLGDVIENINKIAGWDCDCSLLGLNGNPVVLSNSQTVNLQFPSPGGDIVVGTITYSGNNISVPIHDTTYVFSLDQTASDVGFSIPTPTISGNTKTTYLGINLNTFTQSLLNTIGGTPSLLNMLKTLTNQAFNFTVDGKCIINTGTACDYSFTKPSIPASPTSALVKYISVGGIQYPMGVEVSQTTGLVTLTTALNSINKGTFAVSVTNGILTITSSQNPNVIDKIVIYGAGGASDAEMSVAKTNCSGTTTYTPSQIVQAIVNYICLLNTSQITLGSPVAYVTLNDDGTFQTVNFSTTSSLQTFINAVNANNTRLVNLLQGGQALTFQAIANLFPATTNNPIATDYFLGTVNGVPGRWTASTMLDALHTLVYGTNDTAIKNKVCDIVSICNTAVCNPVTYATLSLRGIQKEDFVLGSSALIFNGFYNSFTLPATTTINLTQVNSNGDMGATGTLTMNAGANIIQNAVASLPALASGYSWKITSISGQGANKYAAVQVLNNGSVGYKISSPRLAGSSTPFSYISYPRQNGDYTYILFNIPLNNYEVGIKSNCGNGVESSEIIKANTACPNAGSFNVGIVDQNFVITYSFPNSVQNFELFVTYPQGGVLDNVYSVDNSGQLIITKPNENGNFTFKIRAVCDVNGGWYGSYSAEVNISTLTGEPVAPTATITPSSSNLTTGQNLTLTATVAGTTPITGQWQKGGMDIAGQTARTFVLSNAQTSDAGSYTYVVSNSVASGVSSNAATVAVSNPQTPPTISIAPTSQTITAGDTLTITATIGGTATGLQWKKGGTALTGQTANPLSITNAQTSDTGSYTCDATNIAGTTTSNTATVTVNAPSTINAQYAFSPTDPYTNDTTAPSTGSYTNQAITHNQPISLSLPSDHADNYFFTLRYPDTENIRTAYSDGALNIGTLSTTSPKGDQVFHLFTTGGFIYVVSRSTFSYSPSNPLVFS